jgi:hypothetical protein
VQVRVGWTVTPQDDRLVWIVVSPWECEGCAATVAAGRAGRGSLELEPLQRGPQLSAAVPLGEVLLDFRGQRGEFPADAVLGLLPDDPAAGVNHAGGDDAAAGSVLDMERSAHKRRSCHTAPTELGYAGREMCCAIDPCMPGRTSSDAGPRNGRALAAGSRILPGESFERGLGVAENSAGRDGVFRQRLRQELGLDSDLPDALDRAAGLVRTYGAGGYTGTAFDTYGHNDPVWITSDDLIAVSMLSIQIREQSTSSLRPTSILALDAWGGRVNELLGGVPADRDLHTLTESEFDRWLGPGSPGEELYWLLRKQVGIPRVAVYKLLARKRLALFPIRDTVVEKALGQKADPWWRPWWQALACDSEIVGRLEEIRQASGASHLSLLRVADIVVWMAHRPAGDTEAEE